MSSIAICNIEFIFASIKVMPNRSGMGENAHNALILKHTDVTFKKAPIGALYVML